MNAKRVNGAAGVILAALSQNRTPAGIALALESAALLMTPETAADMASVSTDAVRIAEKAVEELRREHAESARLRARLAEQVVAPAPAPGAFRIVVDLENADDYEDAVYAAEQAQGALRGLGYQSVAVVDTEGERQLAALRARVAELEENLRAVNAGWGVARARVAELEQGPALPWAHAMPDDDLHGFLGDLVSAAMGRWQSSPEVPDREVLAAVEKACTAWRKPGQGYRSDEPEPDALTRVFAPTAALREDGACTECGDAPSKWCTGCAKCSCVAEHDPGCTGAAP